jgi:hypothetical protein
VFAKRRHRVEARLPGFAAYRHEPGQRPCRRAEVLPAVAGGKLRMRPKRRHVVDARRGDAGAIQPGERLPSHSAASTPAMMGSSTSRWLARPALPGSACRRKVGTLQHGLREGAHSRSFCRPKKDRAVGRRCKDHRGRWWHDRRPLRGGGDAAVHREVHRKAHPLRHRLQHRDFDVVARPSSRWSSAARIA